MRGDAAEMVRVPRIVELIEEGGLGPNGESVPDVGRPVHAYRRWYAGVRFSWV